MLVVEFQEVQEFLDELERRPPTPEALVRVTGLWRRQKDLPLFDVWLVASYVRVVDGIPQVIKLRRYLGADGAKEWHRPEVPEAFERAYAQIKEAAGRLSLEVAAGVYASGEGRA